MPNASSDIISFVCPGNCALRVASRMDSICQIPRKDIICPSCGEVICSAEQLATLQQAYKLFTDLARVALDANAAVFLAARHIGVPRAFPTDAEDSS